MGQFTLFATLLGCLAVAFAVSALWQKARGLAIAIAVALPIAAGALYWQKGTPVAVYPANTRQPQSITEAVSQLERLTQADPGNLGDQVTLARAYMAAGRFADAAKAYARASTLQPGDVQLQVEHAEALLRASPDRQFPPEAVRMLEDALKANPQNQRALFFLGLHHRQLGHHAEAVAYWERLLSNIDASTASTLVKLVAEARHDAGLPPMDKAQALLQVRVDVDPTLARELSPGAVLYVFARDEKGEGPPLAVKRITPESWPVTVTLGDGDSPMPTAKLSQQRFAVLGARLSKSGLATPASGDLEADALRVEVKAGTSATLVLTRSVP